MQYPWRAGVGISQSQSSRWQALSGDYLLPRNTAKAIEILTELSMRGELDGAVQAASMYRAGRGTTSGLAEVPNAYGYEKKVEAMRKLTPEMVALIRCGHRNKFG
ncbi:hypothetical protein JI743_07170 [Sphingopyxis sp. DHUNG17]|uniref:hypothetical protein n=1 Tax=Sphingopyxis jiangsuensis TaxID=2871171 RepID=UPI00191D34C2|nr:hypothetical protein [Sphingopyxis lutea]MBL0768580.1 hypothetical protein [Sphingopyxis lutea]